jgi:hypothetical protein
MERETEFEPATLSLGTFRFGTLESRLTTWLHSQSGRICNSSWSGSTHRFRRLQAVSDGLERFDSA